MTCCMPDCTKKFLVTDGVAFPGTCNSEQVEMFFFCSEICYLKGIPARMCVQA